MRARMSSKRVCEVFWKEGEERKLAGKKAEEGVSNIAPH